ncbi:barstar family protein [Saccharomonospora piscinae]|uniref:Barnase inhibitor n=1 Tax=Saccharomonospora piscinae TaxID=687388 RepID=A0A1V8ZX78_SACPI|nr:barstar family protein [Saccharomonospora piscinae]OQO89519.1 barnase inhibitor [Saccharomonospora piscinae]TLW91212.1 barstar family protein [Saccharomonospora piscinae]
MTTVNPRLDSATAADQARARGAYPHVVDAASCPDRCGTLDAIASALSLPDHFGHNLDTLYDGLTDLSWLPPGEHVLIWRAADVLRRSDPRSYLAVHGVLSDAQRALTPRRGTRDGRRLTVVLAD